MTEEIHKLREMLKPGMQGCGSSMESLAHDEFAGRLRRRLMSLTGGDDAVGFDCSASKTAAGDYLVTLKWSEEAMERFPKTTANFSAHGSTEVLAFLRAASQAMHHLEFREMFFRAC